MRKKIIIILMFLVLISIVSSQELPRTYCGDGICGDGETVGNCVIDCSCTCEPKQTITVERTTEEIVTEIEETEVEFFSREAELNATCGVDADLDGILCDPNENFLNCESDCSQPNLDTILCIRPSECVWREAWFVKLLFIGLLGITVYFLISETRLPRGFRR